MARSIEAALSETLDEAFVRPIGCMERLFHLYAQEHPRHFCTVAEISGDIESLDFRRAFNDVQRRHPMLSAYIADDPQRGVSIFQADRQLPVSVLTTTTPSDWHGIVERELRTPLVDSEAPPMRAIVLRARESASIVMTMHHALLDGVSAVIIVEDLLKALCGYALERLPAPPSVERQLEKALLPDGDAIRMSVPAGLDEAKLREIARKPLWRPFAGDWPTVSTVSFDAQETQRIRLRSKAERTTAHGALCAALIRCAPHWQKETYTITNAINLRTALGDADTHAGLMASGITVRFPVTSERPFWDVARQATDDMAFGRSEEGILQTVGMLGGCVPAGADAELACGAFGALAYDAIMSNLGVLALPSRIGSLRIDAFWGPSVQGRFRNEVVIGAAAHDGRLRVIQTSPKHIAPLVKALRDELLNACRDA